MMLERKSEGKKKRSHKFISGGLVSVLLGVLISPFTSFLSRMCVVVGLISVAVGIINYGRAKLGSSD